MKVSTQNRSMLSKTNITCKECGTRLSQKDLDGGICPECGTELF